METKKISTLKINTLVSQEQYDKAYNENKIEQDSIYLVPDNTEEIAQEKANEALQSAKKYTNLATQNKANTDDLNNHTEDANIHVTEEDKSKWNAKSDFSGSYNDLTDTPDIPSIEGLASETFVNSAVNTKADSEHNHDDDYYTETEVDAKFTTVNQSIDTLNSEVETVKGDLTSHATSSNTQFETIRSEFAQADTNTLTTAKEYSDANKSAAVTEAKAYTDSEIEKLVTDTEFEGVLSTIQEIQGAMATDAELAQALEEANGKKIDKVEKGSTTKPIYLDSTGTPQEIAYKIEQDVTADAKLTDTTYTLIKDATQKKIQLMSGETLVSEVDDNNTTYEVATTSNSGLLSAEDKTKLDTIETGATKTVIDSDLSDSSTNPVQNKVVKSALDSKADTGHTHTIANVTNLQTTLDGKSNTGHTHTTSEVSGLATVATSGSYNDLSNQPTIPTKTSQLTNDSEFKTTDTNTTYTLTKEGKSIILTGSDGSTTSVYDNAVSQYISSENKNYPLLMAYHVNTDTTGYTTYTYKNSQIYANPSTGIITATGFKGNLSGNAATATTLNGLTATVNELSYSSGLTGNIQEQLDSKGGIGENVAGQSLEKESGTFVTATEGAEIFNDYRDRTFNSSGYASTGNVATGKYSHAEGNATTASGAASHTEGLNTIANGKYSHAECYYTTASGESSHAEGIQTKASGNYSHAEGSNTKASSDSQHVQGRSNIEDTEGKYAHIVGNGTNPNSRSNAHTLDWDGNAWFAGKVYIGGTSQDDATELGGGGVGTNVTGQSLETAYNTFATAGEGAEIFNDYRSRDVDAFNAPTGNAATGLYSHAEGSGTTASGDYSHAAGYRTTASGADSHAEGWYTKAIGTDSHAEGNATTANANQSHTEGYYTTTGIAYGAHAEGSSTGKAFNYITTSSDIATIKTTWGTNKFSYAKGNASHVEGKDCLALGNYSHVEGFQTIASAIGSSSHGYNTIASNADSSEKGGYAQAVFGKYNAIKYSPSTADTQDSTNADALFIVGCGTSSAKKNAFRVSSGGGCYGASAFNASGADFAELFEWADGNPNNEDRRGLFVTLEGEKIRIANADDDYIGIISDDQAFIGNSASEEWQGKYLTDIFGGKLTQEVEVPEVIDEVTGEVIQEATTAIQYVLNPDYNPDEEYIMRENRKEWGIVGLVGQIVLIDDGTCVVGERVVPKENGIGTASTTKEGYRVMARLDESHIKVLIK